MNLQKSKIFISKKYLAFVASLPCCISHGQHSLQETVVPHHTEAGGRRKRDDLTIPCCYHHHMAYHGLGSREAFEEMYDVDVDDLIKETQEKWREHNKRS